MEKLKLGDAALASGDMQTAVDLYTEGTQLDPRNRKILMSLKKAQGRLKAASVVSEMGAKAHKKQKLGDAAFASGSMQAAVDAYKEGVAIDPQNQDIQVSLKKAQGRLATEAAVGGAAADKKAASDAVAQKKDEGDEALRRGDFAAAHNAYKAASALDPLFARRKKRPPRGTRTREKRASKMGMRRQRVKTFDRPWPRMRRGSLSSRTAQCSQQRNFA